MLEQLSLRLKAFAASLTLDLFYVFRHKEVPTDSECSVGSAVCHQNVVTVWLSLNLFSWLPSIYENESSFIFNLLI